MAWISAEQLSIELKKTLKLVYILFGNSSYLLQENCINITKSAIILDFKESINVVLDVNTDWNYIFNISKSLSLFTKKKILLLTLTQNYPIHYLKDKIVPLSLLVCNNLMLIINICESKKNKKSDVFCLFQCFKETGIFVDCMISEYLQLEKWILNQAESMQLIIDNLACQLLCYYYESNFIVLKQTLQYLSLVYPDGNLSFIRVKQIIFDAAYFNVNHWIEAILRGNKIRANRILKQLEYLCIDFEILLRKIQFEILILIKIKYSNIKDRQLFSTIFKEYKIDNQYYHRMLIYRAIGRLKLPQLYQALELLIKIELQNKINHICISRLNLESLTDILCGI